MTVEVRKIIFLIASIICFFVAGVIWDGIAFEGEQPLAWASWGVASYLASLVP